MKIKPQKKRYKVYTSTITVTELLIDIDIDDDPTEIVIRHYPTSDNDTDRSPLFTITRSELITEMLQRYGEWSFVYNSTPSPNDVYNYATPQFPLVDYQGLWAVYVKYNQDNWDRIATAYAAKYDPISNYDKHGDVSYTDVTTKSGDMTEMNDSYTYNAHTGETTHVYGELGTMNMTLSEPIREENDKITVKNVDASLSSAFSDAGITTQNSSTTYDSAEDVDTTKTNTSGSEQDIPNYIDYSKNLNDHKTSYNNYSETTTHDATGTHVYGNIGVTTSATMVREITEVYKTNFLHMIVDEFAKRYLVYLPVDTDLEEEERVNNDCYIV